MLFVASDPRSMLSRSDAFMRACTGCGDTRWRKDTRLALLASQNVRTSLDQKMMHNVNTAVQQADALLVIVDATSNLAEVVDMPGMAPGWDGTPAALVIHLPFMIGKHHRIY